MRYFRTSPEVYLMVRQGLDTVWGHPFTVIHKPTATEVVTTSCLPPVEQAITDEQGRVYVALPASMTDWAVVAEQIDTLITAGMVVEISEQALRAAMPVAELP